MYPSKILLFGEYSILVNSQALAIPYNKFKADWDFLPGNLDPRFNKAYASNQALIKFASHLKLSEKKRYFKIDIESFEKDLNDGLFLNSNIPTGSGLGSSGALVAAVFDKYTNHLIDGNNYERLQSGLADLESYFHGSSSGFDPLISFLNKAIHINDKKSLAEINLPLDNVLQNYNMFLIDSEIESNTGLLVESFRNKCKNDPEYLINLEQNYIPVNNACIEKLTSSASINEFSPVMRELSHLQLSCFSEMIPESIINLMKSGLDQDLFSLKLCGSGGGGYFLGFTNDLAKSQVYMEKQGYEIIAYQKKYLL